MCHVTTTTTVVSPGDLAFICCLFFVTYLSVRRVQMGLRLRMQVDSLLGRIRATLAGLEAKAAIMSENLATVSSSNFQQRLGLISNYCIEWWSFKLTVTLLRLTAMYCTEEDSMF